LTRDFEKEQRNVTATLIEYLVHWLLHHIVVVDKAMAHQLNVAGPDLDKRVAAALLQDVTVDMTDSERHLLAELRRTNQELERQVLERTRVLSERNRKLEADLREMSALVERLKSGQAT
jgi:C4-dicarboxylate-specific signal transduction histidine kinase